MPSRLPVGKSAIMGSHIGKVGLSKSFAISDASDIKESNKKIHDKQLSPT
jgi:hypothetical protein